MKRLTTSFILAMLAVPAFPLSAREYYVALSGNDEDRGTKAKPFRSVAKAAAVINRGDVCYVRQGAYRETIRLRNFGHISETYTRFVAYPGERVVFSGTEPLDVQWTPHHGNIYKAKVSQEFPQLFLDGEMMTEARWPNCSFSDRWSPDCWAEARAGSV